MSDGLDMIALGGATMGTTWSVRAVCAPNVDPHALHGVVQLALDTVVAQMSHWRDDSDLARYNNLSKGEAWPLPPEFAEVLRCALHVADASDSAFDPTLGALVDAWGFGPSRTARTPPTAAALARLRTQRGWRRLAFAQDGNAPIQPGGISLDLSAIAKGFGADLVARRLRARAIPAALIEVGGELFGYGRKPDGGRWRVLVAGVGEGEPQSAHRDDATPLRTVMLDGCAVATSGDRWHAFEHQGARYAHTLDPRSGLALVDAPVATTVIAETAMLADAWATALTVMGIETGLRFAHERELAVRFLVRLDGRLQERMSRRFAALSQVAT
jgi:thiamine biosynthesis lipoprotein